MLNKSVKLGIVVSTLLLLFGTTTQAADIKEQPKKLTKIKIAYSDPSYAYLLPYTAIKQGFLKQRGIDAEFIKMDLQSQIAAVSRGDIAVATTMGTGMASIMRGMPISVVAVLAEKGGFSLIGHKNIGNLATLRRKLEAGEEVTLGTNNVGGTGDISVRQQLQGAGLPQNLIDKIKTVPAGDDAVITELMKQNKIQLVAVSPPTIERLRLDGWPLITSPSDAATGNPSSSYLIGKEFLTKNKQTVKELIKGTIEARQLIEKNKETAIKMMMEFINDDRQTAELTYPDMNKMLSPDLGSTWETLQASKEARRKQAEIARVVPLSEIFDFELLWQAQKEMGVPLRPRGNPPK